MMSKFQPGERIVDQHGHRGTVLHGPVHPMLCIDGHPDAVPVRFDDSPDLRHEINEIYVHRAES